MTELSREELRAHLSAVEAQVRAALRIIAAESKSVQQAHSALRADLSAALLRLQSDMNTGQTDLSSKLDQTIAELNTLKTQRRLTATILGTMVLIFGIVVGLLAGGSFFVLQKNSPEASLPALSAPAVNPNTSNARIAPPPPPPVTEQSGQADTGAGAPPAQAPAPEAPAQGFILNSN